MAKVLQLVFQNEENKSMTLSINDPKPDLTSAEINAAMATIAQSEAFAREGMPFAEKKSARIVHRHVTEFEVN